MVELVTLVVALQEDAMFSNIVDRNARFLIPLYRKVTAKIGGRVSLTSVAGRGSVCAFSVGAE